MTVKCKLKDIGTVAGRPTADLAVTVAGSKTDAGVTTKMTLDGTAQADLATGQTLQADLSGKMDVSGQTNTPQGPQPVQGDGTLDLHQAIRPVGAPTPAAAAPAVAANGPDATTPPANPLAAAADGSAYEGTFRDGKITVVLQAKGGTPAGTYAGSIAMGDHTYPTTARLADGHLSGQFVADGTPFPFAATVDGRTMQLSSGQNRFTLQKLQPPTPPNPLDAAGGTPNPLGN